MIEERWFPFRAVMAICTLRNQALGELFPMHVFMTILALRRCCFEIDVEQRGLHIGRLVTVNTRGCAMRA